jgi:hypothetical protein
MAFIAGLSASSPEQAEPSATTLQQNRITADVLLMRCAYTMARAAHLQLSPFTKAASNAQTSETKQASEASP